MKNYFFSFDFESLLRMQVKKWPHLDILLVNFHEREGLKSQVIIYLCVILGIMENFNFTVVGSLYNAKGHEYTCISQRNFS